MNLWEFVPLALGNLFKNKLRSFLTMLGITVSITVVVSIISVGNVINKITGDYFYGKTTGCHYDVSVNGTYGTREKAGLSEEELKSLEDSFTDLEIGYVIISQYSYVGEGVRDDTIAKMNVNGVSALYSETAHVNIINGAFLSESDCKESSTAVIISDIAARRLFGETSKAVGEQLTIYNSDYGMVQYTIKGVYEYDNTSDELSVLEGKITNAFIPYTRMNKLALDEEANTTTKKLSVYLKNPTIDSTRLALEKAHKFFGNLNIKYTIVASIDSGAYEVSNIVNMMTYGFASIAMIALFVGGIVLMNTMLICVTERTKEIGILKALGATNRIVLLQFLMESFFICIIACFIGIIFSLVILFILNETVDSIVSLVKIESLKSFLLKSQIRFNITGKAVLVSVLFSVGTGLIFGSYPAKKAADMQPIEALGYE